MEEKSNIISGWEEILSLSTLLDVDAKELRRFVEKVRIDPITGCWLWIAALDVGGYGHFMRSTGDRRGDPVAAHRVAHEWYIGPIPEGFQVHHKCDVRSCVNPNHLEALSIADHVAQTTGHAANQTHCYRGHEFTSENTRIYNGYRCCRACVRINQKLRLGRLPNGAQSSLYCVNDHPLFGENAVIVQLAHNRFRRYCKQCRRDATERYRTENLETVLTAKNLRVADRAVARKFQNRQILLSLRQSARWTPPSTLVLLVQRLLNDCD